MHDGKTRAETRRIGIDGWLTRERYARLPDGSCGALLGSDTRKNTIYNKDKIIELLTGTSGAHFSQTFAWLQFAATSGGAVTYDHDGATSMSSQTAANANGTRRRWTFEDNTTGTYAATWARLYNGDPTDLNGAEDSTQPWYISELNPAFGTKPTDENWHYHYEIEIYSADTDIQATGTARLIQLIDGSVVDHLSAATTTMTPSSGTAITAGGMTAGTDYIEFTFTSPDGNNNVTWTTTTVTTDGASHAAAILRNGGCKTDGTSCGTKTSGEAWTYKWRFDL